MKRFLSTLVVLMIFAAAMFCIPASSLAVNDQTFTLTNSTDGSTVNTGKDNGYSGAKEIKGDDIHFGWSLGKFIMTGYSDVVMEDDIPVFLVNPGDSIILNYQLDQDIEKLNGKENVKISSDTNGYDSAFGIVTPSKGFGRGTLIVQYTDPFNNTTTKPYVDYLANAQYGSAIRKISSLQEGDYLVALDYEIASPAFLSTRYDNYRTTFKFKVRNSNCMVYLRENTSVKPEMANCSVAKNGFILDYANSHYIHVDVTREILTDNGYGLSRTTRSCKRAKDGNCYTDEGIYTVTTTNTYTGKSVTMLVCVGNDQITNAYVTSNCAYDPSEISEMVTNGKATITKEWRIEMIEEPDPVEEESDKDTETIILTNTDV